MSTKHRSIEDFAPKHYSAEQRAAWVAGVAFAHATSAGAVEHLRGIQDLFDSAVSDIHETLDLSNKQMSNIDKLAKIDGRIQELTVQIEKVGSK